MLREIIISQLKRFGVDSYLGEEDFDDLITALVSAIMSFFNRNLGVGS